VLVSKSQENRIYNSTPNYFIPKEFSDSLKHAEKNRYTGIKTLVNKSEFTPSFTPSYFELFFFEGYVEKVIARYGSSIETRTTEFPIAYEVNFKQTGVVNDTVVFHYGLDGAKLFEYHLSEGVLNGQFREYYSDGNIKEMISYEKGYEVFRVGYWSNGNPEYIGYYKPKTKSYKIERFLSNGEIKFECEYEDYGGKRPIKGTLINY
jgi:antitoxin component YwqK of YwqJK toxin-antitoxin module